MSELLKKNKKEKKKRSLLIKQLYSQNVLQPKSCVYITYNSVQSLL